MLRLLLNFGFSTYVFVSYIHNLGYTLNYRESSGEWKELQVDVDNESYTFENLKCGTRYQFYITSVNRIGTSEPSDMLDITIEGQSEYQLLYICMYTKYYKLLSNMEQMLAVSV